MNASHPLPCRGVVRLDGWAGRSEVSVEVLRATPKYYEVRFLESAYRFTKGAQRLVPRHAVRLGAPR